MMPAAEPPSSPIQLRRSIITALLLIAMALLVGVGLYRVFHPAVPSAAVRFQVQKGHSAREVARELQAQGVIRYRWTFLLGSKIFRHKAIRPGVYDISADESGLTLYRQFLQGPPKVRVTFPEGWTAKQMASLLETRGVCPADAFLDMVSREKREGFLFPDTYFFEEGLSADLIVQRLVERFREKVPKDFKEQAKALRLSYGQLVTLASIVEREARAAQERPLIAGVFYNRLKKHWYLESCATVEYALGSWKPHLTYKDLAVESPYNTYRHAGLPPGPICNPGAAALDAAAHPAQTDMMFFVADSSGTHRFSRDYDEHLAVQKRKK